MANASEKQLKEFLKTNLEVVSAFILKPQGNLRIINNDGAIYMAEIRITQKNKFSTNIVYFGGIREIYYDKLQKKYAKHIGYKHSGGAVEVL